MHLHLLATLEFARSSEDPSGQSRSVTDAMSQRTSWLSTSSHSIRHPASAKMISKLSSPASSVTASSSSSESECETKQSPSDEVELGFSFSGGGWLMIYMYGVAKALRERDAHKNARFIGTSAGSMAAMGLYLGADFDAIREAVLADYLAIARGSLRGAFLVREFLEHAMVAVGNVQAWEKTKADPRACRVVYTSLSAMKSRRKSTFESQEDLVGALMASCTATPIAGFPFVYDGEWVMDGGVFDNQPLFTEEDGVKRTVTITPNVFDATADIKPSKYIPPWWSLYPPTEADLRWVFALGHEDGLAWCSRNGFTGRLTGRSRGQHHPVKEEQTQERVYRTKKIEYKTVLGQVVGYPIFEKIGNLFPFTSKISVYTLLKVELTLWMVFDICWASVDAVLICWTCMVAAALAVLLADGTMASVECECFVLCTTYVLVCAARLHHKSHEVMTTAPWQQVKLSLEGMKQHAGTDTDSNLANAHGVKVIQDWHGKLPPHHHDTLVEHSLLYRISTLLHV